MDQTKSQTESSLASIEFLLLKLAARSQGHQCIGLAQAEDEELRTIGHHSGLIHEVAHYGQTLLGKLLTVVDPDDLAPTDTTAAGELVRLLAELHEATGEIAESARYLANNPDEKAEIRSWYRANPAA